MLQVSNLSKSYGDRVLFEGVTFTVDPGEIVGLVGRNGCGKSTLFKILTKQEEADSGDVIVSQGYKVGYLNQHISFSKPTLLEECVQALPKEMEFEHYRAEKILFGLGFTQEDMERNPSEFSGGYQLRINLVKCLLGFPDLLLLDEPTNYLDILSLRWMRQFLRSFTGEVILITHDRDFMDSVVNQCMGLHRKNLRKIKGDTEKYYQQLSLDEEIYEKTRVNQERKLENMQRFVERFRAKASKATQAQSMLKKIEKMSVLSQMDAEQVMGFRFNYQPTPAKRPLEVHNLKFAFKKDEPLFEDLSFDLKSTDRLAIIGKNGKGKTTLLNVLAGQLPGYEGEIKSHHATKMGYYQQTNKKDLNKSFTVLQEIEASNTQLDQSRVRGICGAMMFSADDAKKKISILSGGEQGRVLLGKVLARPSNLLLLDEPTNHLDMEAVEVLTEEIDQFEGPAILVTHNEKMLHRLANKLIVFHRGGAELFLGSYAEFLEKIGWEEDAKVAPKKSSQVSIDRKEAKRLRAQLVTERSRHLKPLKREFEELEAEIEAHEKVLEEKNNEVLLLLQDSSSGVGELYQEIGQIQLQLESRYERLAWLSDEIERSTSEYEKKLESL